MSGLVEYRAELVFDLCGGDRGNIDERALAVSKRQRRHGDLHQAKAIITIMANMSSLANKDH